MCDRRWAIGILLIGTLLLGAASDAAAQGGNPNYMNHFVGRQARHNLYLQLRIQGKQLRTQEELARAEVARVKSQAKFERKYASLKLPGSSWQSANTAPSLADSESTQSSTVPHSNLGLTKRDVDAMREHYAALADMRELRREQITGRSSRKQVARSLPSQLDRTSGEVAWPALLVDDSRFQEDVQRVNQGLASWAQHGHDPTSLAALRVRQTIEKMTRDLLVMRGTGLIDEAAYNTTRTFLKSTAYETQLADGKESSDITADLASTH